LRTTFQLKIQGLRVQQVAITRELVDKIRFCINTNDKIVPTWLKVY